MTHPPTHTHCVTSPALQGYGFCPVYSGEETAFTCQALARLMGYTFRLSAANERGSSSFSRSVTFHTLADVPCPPGPPHLAERARSSSLHVAWQAPSDDGGTAIHGYILQMDGGLGGEMATCYQGPETSYVAESLSPGRSVLLLLN